MKKTILLLSTAIAAIAASAYDFKATNADGVTIYYNIISSGPNKTCEVTRGEASDDYCGDMSIPSEAANAGAIYSVGAIGQNAFSECYDLTSVTLPESVVSIRDYAFESCTYLERVRLPHSLTVIGEGAFESCSSLTSVEIPENVVAIGTRAFSFCPRLQSFSGKFASADGRCLIADNVLNSFAPAGLTSYEIPAYVTSIGDCAFSDCSDLTSVEIPDKVTSIGKDAFLCCYGLTTLTLPSSLVTIGDDAFGGCQMASLTIPGAVVSIGDRAFTGCDRITSVEIPNSVATIGEGAFELCKLLASVSIPSSIISIGNSAFSSCESLESFSGKFASVDGRCLIVDNVLNSFAPAGLSSYEIPETVTEIGVSALARCSKLTSLRIPDSVTLIGENAFIDCSSLESLIIPAKVASIGDPGFAGCSSLKQLVFMSAIPPSAPYNAFANDPTRTCVLLVPTEAAVEAYRAADYWRDFLHIECISQ